jgi:hypothetical protein
MGVSQRGVLCIASYPPAVFDVQPLRLFREGKGHRFPFGFLYPLLQKIPPRGWTGVWEQGGIHLSFKEDHIYWESNIVQKKKKGYLYILEGDMDFSIPGGLRLQVRCEKQGSK